MSCVIMFKIHTQKKGLIFHSKTSELVASEPHETQEKGIKKLHVMSSASQNRSTEKVSK